ncbi:Op4 protein [Scheffersomyces amazonensis]|uniref:Op4 protein n=1 Tax=Scheffersomyces amazonensis TaxID=1078765 RepID=UPI00315C8795
MKLTNAAILTILASSTFVSAAPAIVTSEQSLVKRADVNEVLEILEELKTLKVKRELLEGEELAALEKRADSVIGNLISALLNSGIISDVWSTLTTNPAVSAEIKTIIESAIKGAIVEGPALISAIWNSGLLSKLFNDFVNDPDLKSAFLGVAKAIFTTGLNLIKSWLGLNSSSASTTTAAAAPAASGAAKRDLVLNGDSEFIDKRDVASIVSWVVSEISSSGIVSSLVNKVLANPQASIDFLASAFKTGLVVVEDVYGWAKGNGLLQDGLNYLAAHGGTFGSAIASFLGDQIASGNVSASDIDSAPLPSKSAATSIASTAAVAPLAAPLAVNGAATTAAQTTAAPATTAAPVPTPAASDDNAVLNSLINAYGTPATTTAAPNLGGISGDINTLVGAANQIAGSLKKRRIAY